MAGWNQRESFPGGGSPERIPHFSHESIGEVLVKRKVITREQLRDALEKQDHDKRLLGEILAQLGYVEERDIIVAVILQCNIPYIAINKYDLDPDILRLVPGEFARSFHVIPLDRVGNVVSIVMADPLHKGIREQLEGLTKFKVAPFISTPSEIDSAIAKWYR